MIFIDIRNYENDTIKCRKFHQYNWNFPWMAIVFQWIFTYHSNRTELPFICIIDPNSGIHFITSLVEMKFFGKIIYLWCHCSWSFNMNGALKLSNVFRRTDACINWYHFDECNSITNRTLRMLCEFHSHSMALNGIAIFCIAFQSNGDEMMRKCDATRKNLQECVSNLKYCSM